MNDAIDDQLKAKLPVWVKFGDSGTKMWYRGIVLCKYEVGFLVAGVLRCLTYCLAM